MIINMIFIKNNLLYKNINIMTVIHTKNIAILFSSNKIFQV